MKRVSVLGATGSIGQSTIDLIGRAPNDFRIVALTGGRNIAQLARDARALKAQFAVTAHEDLLDDLRAALEGSGVRAAAGRAAIKEAGGIDADLVVGAIIGAAGLEPCLKVLQQGAVLALANKECMVCAGALMQQTARDHNARIIPVDSEHTAIYQSLLGGKLDEVRSVQITASGGAFRNWTREQMARATPGQAATHPNWDMGQRITIDSASMFNKALELIEARELFGLAPEQVSALIHPESLVHALVHFRDGGTIAHLGVSDMRHAIGYALNWPERRDLPLDKLDLAEAGQLNFSEPDEDRYPALRLARAVMAQGGVAGAIFNAAKERALDHFLARDIGFLQMAEIVEKVLEGQTSAQTAAGSRPGLQAVLEADLWARERASLIARQL